MHKEANAESGEELFAALEKANRKIAELESQIHLDAETRWNIREIEGKYKYIVNAYGELMTLINRDYVYELVNDSLCRAFGRSNPRPWRRSGTTRSITLR